MKRRNRMDFAERLSVRQQNEGISAGWWNEPSFVQLELKPRNMIAPEIQAMVDNIQRNAVIRELALRAEFERKLGQGRSPSSPA